MRVQLVIWKVVLMAVMAGGCTLMVDFDQKSVCGNGLLERGEDCDGDIASLSVEPCNDGNEPICENCQWICPGYCGDGIIDPDIGENCEANHIPPTSCSQGEEARCVNCQVVCVSESCGNDNVDVGEVCDGSVTEESTCQEVTGKYFGEPQCNLMCRGWDNCYAGLLYGGIDNDKAVDVVSDAEGNLYVLGTTESLPGSFNEDVLVDHLQAPDIIIMKVTPQGGVEWVKRWGTDQNDQAVALAIDQQKHLLYALGEKINNNNNELDSDLFLVKFNLNDFSMIQSNVYGEKTANGVTSTERAADVVVNANGDVYLSGSTNASTIGNFSLPVTLGGMKAVVLKVDPWNLTLNGAYVHERNDIEGGFLDDIGGGLINMDDFLYWTGAAWYPSSNNGQFTYKVFVMKFDYNLEMQAEGLALMANNTVVQKAVLDGGHVNGNQILYVGGILSENNVDKSFLTRFTVNNQDSNIEGSNMIMSPNELVHQLRFDADSQTLWALGITNTSFPDFSGSFGQSDAFLAKLHTGNLNKIEVHYYGGHDNDEGLGLTLMNNNHNLPCMVGAFHVPDETLNFKIAFYSNLLDMAIWCLQTDL